MLKLTELIQFFTNYGTLIERKHDMIFFLSLRYI